MARADCAVILEDTVVGLVVCMIIWQLSSASGGGRLTVSSPSSHCPPYSFLCVLNALVMPVHSSILLLRIVHHYLSHCYSTTRERLSDPSRLAVCAPNRLR